MCALTRVRVISVLKTPSITTLARALKGKEQVTKQSSIKHTSRQAAG